MSLLRPRGLEESGLAFDNTAPCLRPGGICGFAQAEVAAGSEGFRH